jgi:hypothetical protein
VLAGGGDVAVQGQPPPGQGAPAPESFCCSFTILSGAAENPNALPPWAEIVLAKPATATAQTQMPYLTDISDQLLARILHSEWPHEQVLAALDVQNVNTRQRI